MYQVSVASCQWFQLQAFRTPAICQPIFDTSAQLQSVSTTSRYRPSNLSALAAADQLSCSVTVRLPRSQSTSKRQLRCTPCSPTAVFQPVCNQLARLHSVSTAA
ncbi:TPA: hypothetical protein ACH3X3_002090 [Trebouxia sp. C0006]